MEAFETGVLKLKSQFRKKVLLLTNIDAEMNNPYFRQGAYSNYLFPMGQALNQSGAFSVRYLMNRHIFKAFKQGKGSRVISNDNTFIVDPVETAKLGLSNAMTESYRSISSKKYADFGAYVTNILGEWVPDVIICWEAPTGILRKIFPAALVLDVMPSMFMRPPFPKAISIDPVGIYEQCWFSVVTDPSVEQDDLDLLYSLRGKYNEFFDSLGCERHFKDLLNVDACASTALVPLQISNYFGFKDNCGFLDQLSFLEYVALKGRGDVVLPTQYVGNFISEKIINEDTLAYLRDLGADMRYDSQIEILDSASQFIVPWIDRVYSISSTIGLQAKFFGKELISPSTSHLRFLADICADGDVKAGPLASQADNIVAKYLKQGMLFLDRISSEPGYFANVVNDMVSKREAGCLQSDLLPNPSVVDNTYQRFISYSKFTAASRNFRKLFPSAPLQVNTVAPADCCNAIKSEDYKVVSFDIFDTLVQRLVFKPEDVFYLIQDRLSKQIKPRFPEIMTKNFAELRVAAERMARGERDKLLASGDEAKPEEISIQDIYMTFSHIIGENIDIEEIVKIEEETELSVLRPRQVGKFLYELALSSGKYVILTSDFVHSEDFIGRVLKSCGYTNHDRLYLSSSVGLKKHSGAIFSHLLADLGVKAEDIVHIGDNPIGDILRPKERGIKACLVPSGRVLAVNSLKARGASTAVVDKSFFLRTVFGLFGNKYLFSTQPRQKFSEVGDYEYDFQLMSNLEEIGFLVLGPIVQSFAEWIIELSEKENVDQIIFFARDCYLPYEASKELIKSYGDSRKVNLIYAPTSRKSVTGMEIFQPEDVLRVRIDDFTNLGALKDLFSERFLVSADEVPAYLLKKWNIESLNVQKKFVDNGTIYGLVLELFKTSWKFFEKRFADRRRNFREFMQGNSDIDFTRRTIAVDFGYQGSIHKKLGGVFENEVIPAFFMTYSDGYGRDPIAGAEVYYQDNCNPQTKSNICITHNLLLETFLNEADGSALDLAKVSTGGLFLMKDKTLGSAHLDTIRRMHLGALSFCRTWSNELKGFKHLLKPERDSVTYFFSLLALEPTKAEAILVRNLVFDNSFAGVGNVSVVSVNGSGSRKAAVWPQGEAVLQSEEVKAIFESQAKARAKLKNKKRKKKRASIIDRGVSFYKLGDFAQAKQCFIDASILQPTEPNFLRALAETHVRLGEIPDAIVALRKVRALAPRNKNARRRLLELSLPAFIRKRIRQNPFTVEVCVKTSRKYDNLYRRGANSVGEQSESSKVQFKL